MKRLKKKEPYSELFGSDEDDDDEEDKEGEEKKTSQKDDKQKEEPKKEEEKKPKRQLGVRCVRLTYASRPTYVRLQNHHAQLEVRVPVRKLPYDCRPVCVRLTYVCVQFSPKEHLRDSLLRTTPVSIVRTSDT